jgi:hypothetical protein
MVGAERVHLVRGKWNSQYIEELRLFPGGNLKDQVDASSRAFQQLVGNIPAAVNAGPELMEEGGSTATHATVDNDDPWGA